jgi:hypothetical protein
MHKGKKSWSILGTHIFRMMSCLTKQCIPFPPGPLWLPQTPYNHHILLFLSR